MSLAEFDLLDDLGNLIAGPQNSTLFSNLGPGNYSMQETINRSQV
jgi:hypothetical protein